MGVLVGVGPNIHTRECKTHPPILLLIKISSSKTEIKKDLPMGLAAINFSPTSLTASMRAAGWFVCGSFDCDITERSNSAVSRAVAREPSTFLQPSSHNPTTSSIYIYISEQRQQNLSLKFFKPTLS